MEASTSAGVILKIIECMREIHSKQLLDLTKNLKKQADIQLYTYKIDYTGNLNSADYWNDLSLLASSGLIKFIGENPKLAITERGLDTIRELELELPPQIVEALPPEVCRRR